MPDATNPLYQADSKFLHHLMQRVIQARVKHAQCFEWVLDEERREIREAIEMGHGSDRVYEELLDLAATCVRLATEELRLLADRPFRPHDEQPEPPP